MESIQERKPRRITFTRLVNPAEENNQYEVVLSALNRGKGELTDIRLKDFIPTGFKIIEEGMKSYDTQGRKKGVEKEWLIEKIMAGEEIQISYKILKIDEQKRYRDLLNGY